MVQQAKGLDHIKPSEGHDAEAGRQQAGSGQLREAPWKLFQVLETTLAKP